MINVTYYQRIIVTIMDNTYRVNIIIILILINVYCVLTNIQSLYFFKPGNYTLSKQDYNNSDNLIIEMWGGGSGSYITYYKSCNKSFCYQNGYTCYGGNSGAYVRANIITNGENFDLVVGSGGISTKIPEDDNNNGKDTILMNQNKLLHLIAGGGPGPGSRTTTLTSISNYALSQYYIDNNIYGYVINYANGNQGNISQSNISNCVNGAISPYTLCIKGQTCAFSEDYECLIEINDITLESNKFSPGGGACCQDLNLGLTMGGNGGIIIYYNTILSPSASLSPSPTYSVTNSISISASKTSIYSITKTPSLSPSVSYSPSTSDIYTFREFTQEPSFKVFFFVLVLLFLCIIFFSLGMKKMSETNERMAKENMNLEEQLKFCESRKDEQCMLCLTLLETYKCEKYDHYYCFECLSHDKVKFTCPLCKFKFIYEV